MNNEDYIKNKVGSKNSFKAPDGYFNSFASQLMEKLPEREAHAVVAEKKSLTEFLRPVLYAAACLCVAVFSAALFFTDTDSRDAKSDFVAANDGKASVYVETEVDYAMMDNVDIYAYLSNE